MTYADIKIRKEHAQTLRDLSMMLNVKIADVVAWWPKCPRCGGPLVQVGEAVVCSKCRRGYALTERP
jgi:tRNA(Ile2) C34 agmatinyltransferase TiaS